MRMMARTRSRIRIDESALINTLFVYFIYSTMIVDAFRIINNSFFHSGLAATNLFRAIVYIAGFLGVVLLSFVDNRGMKRMAITLLSFFIVALLSIVINPDTLPLIISGSVLFISRIAPTLVLASMITDFDKAVQSVIKMKWIVVAYMIVFLSVGQSSERYYYMHVGYNLLYPALFLLFSAGKQRVIDKLIAVASILVILLYCARGTVLVMVPAVGLYYLIQSLRVKSRGKRVAVIIFIFAVCILLVFYLDKIFQYLYEIFPKSRSLRYIMEGDMMDSSGRDKFYSLGFHEFLQHPLNVMGIYGDRVFYGKLFEIVNIEGCFAHNVMLEFLLQFGVILGGFICIAFLAVVLSGVVSGLKLNTNAAVSMTCAIVLPSFLISMSTVSYLNTFETALMVGLCLAFQRQFKTKKTAKQVGQFKMQGSNLLKRAESLSEDNNF